MNSSVPAIFGVARRVFPIPLLKIYSYTSSNTLTDFVKVKLVCKHVDYSKINSVFKSVCVSEVSHRLQQETE